MFLYQPTSGYCYNSDSIFLYDFISTFNPKGSLLDVGCGVGIISLLLGRDFDIEVSAVDKQSKMLSYAEHNFEINKIDAALHLGDFQSFESAKRFDTIVSNPPFYDSSVTQSSDEHINTARYAHHLPFREFTKNVKMLLKPRGRFIFCYDAKQIDMLLSELVANKINPEVLRFVHSKIDRDSKLVMISARMGSKSMVKILPPLVVFDDASNYRKEAELAFAKADTHTIKATIA